MRNFTKSLLSFIIILSAITYAYGQEVDHNKESGFEKIRESYIESIDSTVIIYNHLASGAQVVYAKNKDPNKVFSIGFRTPIHDNTGVNHIVEHAVFTGSEKFNEKDVFFKMKKASPNIFMNASTAADMTIYPFSTRNNKDYINLLDVYLDAVFFPNLQKNRFGFDQEGWHYSIDQDDQLNINGVVYNEMKGANVMPRRILAMANRTVMFPDTMYIYNAGGNQEEIPQLSYDSFKQTHKSYYVPSNSCAFIYGDLDISYMLKKLDHYYSRFERQASQNISQKQTPFKKPKSYKQSYPSSDPNKGYFISSNYAVGGMEDIKLQLSMEILMDLLVVYEKSPLKEAFNKDQKSKTLSYDIDGSIPQPMYSIIATDVKKEDISQVGKLIQETLQQAAQNGFEADLIQMAINNYEIREKQQISNVSKGIDMAYRSIYSWGHGVCPIKMLEKHQLIEEIKKEGDSLYFQELLRKHILENKHHSQVILEPDENYIKKAQEKEIKDIERQDISHSYQDKQAIIQNKDRLEKWQQASDSLSGLPQVKLKDLSQSPALPQLTIKQKKNRETMYYIADTNDLIYLDLYFDTSYIPQESIYELFLFSYLIGEMEKDLVGLYTGGMNASTLAIPSFADYGAYDPKLKLSICVEKENMKKAFEILGATTVKEKTWDKEWVLIQINKIRSQYQDYINAKPMEMMNIAIASSQEGAPRYNYENIIPFYQYICELSDNYDHYQEQLIGKLKIIDKSIFNQESAVLGATLEEDNIKPLEKSYKRYFKRLTRESYPKANYDFSSQKKRQGFPIASDVQYTVWGGNYKKAGGIYNGSLYLVANIIKSDYMLENARVKNGAYGAGINFDPYGSISLYTYQDPQLTQTLETIQALPAYIEQLDLDSDALDDYKIGALSQLERELGLNEHPKIIGETLQEYYLSGINYEIIESIRKDIIDTSMEDIQKHGPAIEKVIQEQRYSIAGSEGKLLTHKNKFDIIQSFASIYNYFH